METETIAGPAAQLRKNSLEMLATDPSMNPSLKSLAFQSCRLGSWLSTLFFCLFLSLHSDGGGGASIGAERCVRLICCPPERALVFCCLPHKGATYIPASFGRARQSWKGVRVRYRPVGSPIVITCPCSKETNNNKRAHVAPCPPTPCSKSFRLPVNS